MYVGAEVIAQRFGVSEKTVTSWRKRLGLPALRMSKGRRGGLVLFKVEYVDRWAEQFKKGGT